MPRMPDNIRGNKSMRNTLYDEKRNILSIRTELIMPKNCSREEHRKAFTMSYKERLERFCPKEIRTEIEKEIAAHPGCKLSEFTDPY